MKEAEEKSTRKKGYVPADKDYMLCGIRIDYAENGVVVDCDYHLRPEIKEKVQKQNSMGGPYCDSYIPPEKHVFESKEAAKEFILSELNELWPS